MVMGRQSVKRALLCVFLFVVLAGCASSGEVYFDQYMDFGVVKTVGVLTFKNLTPEKLAAERVSDVFMSKLMATEAVYVLPPGEVMRGVSSVGLSDPAAPSTEEATRLGSLLEADALFTGVLKEYGNVRSGNASANIISVSVKMIETQTGKVVWIGSTTKGGIDTWDRLFGGGGEPMNEITEAAVDDLLDKLLQ